jgi:hypothetical protein
MTRAWISIAFVASVLTACSAAPESNASSDEALKNCTDCGGGGDTGGTGGPSTRYYCPTVNAGACVTSQMSWASFPNAATLMYAGCLDPIDWHADAAMLGEHLTLCPRSSAVDAWVAANPGSAETGACDACVPRAATNSVWVRLNMYQLNCGQPPPGNYCSPYCPSGCGVVTTW